MIRILTGLLLLACASAPKPRPRPPGTINRGCELGTLGAPTGETLMRVSSPKDGYSVVLPFSNDWELDCPRHQQALARSDKLSARGAMPGATPATGGANEYLTFLQQLKAKQSADAAFPELPGRKGTVESADIVAPLGMPILVRQIRILGRGVAARWIHDYWTVRKNPTGALVTLNLRFATDAQDGGELHALFLTCASLFSFGQNSYFSLYSAEAAQKDAQFEDAVPLYRAALTAHGQDPLAEELLLKANLGLGTTLNQIGQPEEALPPLNEAIALAARLAQVAVEASAAYQLARSFATVGKPKDALRWLTRAIELEPTHRASAREDAAFERLRKKRKEWRRLLAEPTEAR